MSLFSPLGLRHLSEIFEGIRALHEHTAIHAVPNLQKNAVALQKTGHHLVIEFDKVAIFLEKGNLRLELINAEDAPEHEAWLMSDQDELQKAHERFVESPEFEWLEEYQFNRPNLVTRMYHHKQTGTAVQIVWRQTIFYEGLVF